MIGARMSAFGGTGKYLIPESPTADEDPLPSHRFERLLGMRVSGVGTGSEMNDALAEAFRQQDTDAALEAARTEAGAAGDREALETAAAAREEAWRAEVDELKAKVSELAAAKADVVDVLRRAKAADGTELAKAKADAADAKKRLAEVEAAAQSLRSGADAVRQKFQQLESENATLRASGNGVEFEPEDRFVYLKNLMCEYLATAPEDSARAPMERAMKAVIGFDDSDAKRLEAKKAEHAKRALGGLAVFFGSG